MGPNIQLFQMNVTPLAVYRCKMAFFNWAWRKVKVLPQLNPFKSKEPLIRAFKWGIIWVYTSSGFGDTKGQTWKFQKSPFLLSKFKSFKNWNNLMQLNRNFEIIISILYLTRKCPLRGHILAPPEGLRAPELPGINPGGQPHESGDDSKVI